MLKSQFKKFVRVPYGMSVHGKEEINAVIKTLNFSTQMSTNVINFENKVSKLFSKKYSVMVNSGSSALMLAFEILDFPKNSEIITPVLTFATTVSYAIKSNLKPVFVDVKKNTYCIDEDKIESLITKKTRAILAPNLLGNIVNWKKIKKIIKGKNIIIIEDSADIIGAKINNDFLGKDTDISTTSFYGSHIINCAGNGGMISLNNKKLFNKAKLLRSWGRSSSLYKDSEKIENRFNIKLDGIDYDKKFVFQEIGHNLEPSEIGAAFGLVQLKNLDKNIENRVKNFNSHQKFFSKYKNFFILPKQLPNTLTGWLAYPLTISSNAPFKRKDLQIFLEKRNIQTRVVFTGNILRQPGFKFLQKKKLYFPEADKVMKYGILIGCHHGLTEKMKKHLYSSIKLFMKKFI